MHHGPADGRSDLEAARGRSICRRFQLPVLNELTNLPHLQLMLDVVLDVFANGDYSS